MPITSGFETTTTKYLPQGMASKRERLAVGRFSAKINRMLSVQIFGLKGSAPTRAAERFFKERRIAIHFVDLKQKPMSPGEIKRFIDRFGLQALLDTESKSYGESGLRYLKISDSELLKKIEADPRLLRLPLTRAANRLGIGQDEAAWQAMLTAGVEATKR